MQVKETQKQCLFRAQLEKLQQVKRSAVWILAIIIITNMAFSYQDLSCVLLMHELHIIFSALAVQ